ncbi:MAG: Gfo/Idh/MocA family oxidoreductase, partial [Clostridia bacterium]|nr:Gfo/Idh/MocA family oxidoreductase [Clostridia bacterium]
MKIALVGVGGMGTVHFNIYKKLENIDFVAACDIRLDMLKEKAGENSPIRLYADYEEMLQKEKPDIVDVCTPTYLHAEQVIMAMESGAHVLSEKPMGLSAADCDKILAAMNKTGKHYMTAQVVRFMNDYIYLRNLIESKKYGKLESLTMRRFSHVPRWSWDQWMKDEKRSGLVALDLMCHDVDFMQSVLGDPLNISGFYKDMENNTNY